ncbi:MAG TPA: amidohydrolase family protein [Candidatus Dormibacteraeota bacterium]|nr:amidohydrolase family protein [Candidatus Dormibacteraeota bacterium]
MNGKIALEEHFITADFDQPSVNLPGARVKEVYRRLLEVDAERLEGMDRSGIDFALLSLNMPGIQGEVDPRVAVGRSVAVNNELARVVARNSHRYAGFAAVAMQDPPAAADELSRCVTDLGFKGAMIHGYSNIGDSATGEYLDEEKCLPFWERAESLGVPVYLHPRNPLSSQMRIYEGHPELMAAVWAFTVETATHALRLITSGLFDTFPKLNIILGHMGETLPFAIWRVDHAFGMGRGGKELKKPLAEYLSDNFFITTAGNFSTPALLATLAVVGSDRVMFSVDYPWESMDEGAKWFDAAPLSDEDRLKIGRTNAEKLFGLADAS